MDQDKVSVLLAVPSDEVDQPSTREALQSIASQSYPASLIETLQIQYVPQTPGGRTAALNAARDQAKGEFLIYTEAGVTWDPAKVERQVLLLREGEETSAAGSAHLVSVRDAGGKLTRADFSLIKSLGLRLATLLTAPWKPGALLIRSDVMHGLGAYRHIEQQVWEHDIRLAERDIKVEILDEDLAVWNTKTPDPSANLRRALFPVSIRESFLKQHLDRTDFATFTRGEVGSVENQQLILAALHLFNDDLEESHTICQAFDREFSAASFWHGLIHRREPDFKNAQGWFARASSWEGLLEIRDSVQDVIQRILLMPEYGAARDTAFGLKRHLDAEGIWDPAYFIEMCSAHRDRNEPDPIEAQLLIEIQESEMVSALSWTHRSALAT